MESPAISARAFAIERPDLPELRHGLAHALARSGADDEALAVLATVPGDRARIAAGILLMRSGRFLEAMDVMPPDHPHHAIAGAGAALMRVAPPDGAFPAGSSFDRAIAAELEGRWADAAEAWRSIGHDDAAVDASLAGGVVGSTPPSTGTWMGWRHYALTGTGRPADAPVDPVSHRHRELGDLRQRLASLTDPSLPERPAAPPAEGDPFGVALAESFAAAARRDPADALRRLGVPAGPGSPSAWIAAPAHATVTVGAEAIRTAQRDLITSWPGAAKASRPAGPDRSLAEAIRTGTRPAIDPNALPSSRNRWTAANGPASAPTTSRPFFSISFSSSSEPCRR